jgi:hypothetical protein
VFSYVQSLLSTEALRAYPSASFIEANGQELES